MGSCISTTIHNKNQPSAKVDMSEDLINSSSIPPTPVKDNNNNNNNNKPSFVVVDPPPIMSNSFKSRVSPFNSISSYRSHGSRDETFYDTQGWLESDCEDDFHSVGGDFTPSRGNTPVHPSVATPRLHKTFSPQVNRSVFDVKSPLNSASLRSRGSTSVRKSFSSIPEITRTSAEGVAGISQDAPLKPQKKKLADLFRESMSERGNFSLNFPGYESDSSQKTGMSPNKPALPPKPRTGTSPLSTSRAPDNYVLQKDKSTKSSHRCFPKLVSIRNFNESKKGSTPTSPVDNIRKTQER